MNHSSISFWVLARRFFLVLCLVVQAGWLYFRSVGINRSESETPPDLTKTYCRFAKRYVRFATREKGALIKLGQLASLQVDVLPYPMSEIFARLQDRVEPHPQHEIVEQIESAFGNPMDQIFDSFDQHPIAAASLGQVHRARLIGGERVAVKVLYPGIESTVAVDLAGARIGLWLFNFVTIADLRQVYREIRLSLLGEMDYEREGRVAEEIAGNLFRDEELSLRVRVPRIHWATTRRRVLTMEYIEGAKLVDHARGSVDDTGRRRLVFWIARAFLQMMFKDGLFHCDPHPGNILVDASGRIVIIDFGMNKRLLPNLREGIRKNVLASVRRDPKLYAESLLDAGVIDGSDLSVVEGVAQILFDPTYYNLTPGEVVELDLGLYIRRIRSQLRQVSSFRLPDGMVMWFRSFTLLLALATEVAPGMRPLDVLAPHVLKYLVRPNGNLAQEEDAV